MKYLNKFNESLNLSNDLKKECEPYLAFLLDDGFKLNVSKQQRFKDDDKRYKVELTQMLVTELGHFKHYLFEWDDIKDDYLSFLSYIVDNFDIVDDLIYFETYSYYEPTTNINTRNTKEFTISSILNNDEIVNNYISDLQSSTRNKYERLATIFLYLYYP